MRSRERHQIRNPRSRIQNGFTLVELLTVIGIIVLLVSILLPVVSAVRTKGHQADTNALMARIATGAEAYYSEFRAYPGPFHNGQIGGASMPVTVQNTSSAQSPASAQGTITTSKITQNENWVLGLLGGLYMDNSNKLSFDYNKVGAGPVSLNPADPKKFHAYMNKESLSAGDYRDEAGDADDTQIPEFLDKFPDPMPLLIMRANVGAAGLPGAPIASNQTDITKQSPYDLHQIIGYTGKNIGVGRDVPQADYKGGATYPQHGLRTADPTSTTYETSPPPNMGTKYIYPYDLVAFMRHPSLANTPRQKDGYILISAGADRVYGTKDDITYPASR